MGKKRKAGGQPFGHGDSENTANENSTLRINDWQDVADSEDEFHINQDKIFLEEGPAQKRQRKAQEAG
jgi:U3 small nucleolar RNA-associated protein 3